jgi:hypothetical protein
MLALSVPASAKHPTIITFDAPGAGTGAFFGTIALGINPAGMIVGFDIDPNVVIHGFLRGPDGTLTTIDAPGAGTGFAQGTFLESINPGGAIAGSYVDASDVSHGFLRTPSGTFITFDAPGAGTGTGTFQGTFPDNINPAGAIAGTYADASNVSHGFLRAADGAITTFDAPGAGTGAFQGTFMATIEGLNPAGAIAGNYRDANNVNHGYVRDSHGTITTFDVPGRAPALSRVPLPQGSTQGGRFQDSTLTRMV